MIILLALIPILHSFNGNSKQNEQKHIKSEKSNWSEKLQPDNNGIIRNDIISAQEILGEIKYEGKLKKVVLVLIATLS